MQDDKAEIESMREAGVNWNPTSFIANSDGSMLVSAVHGLLYVTWVSRANREYAMRFPVNKVVGWLQVITQITEMDCIIVKANDRSIGD